MYREDRVRMFEKSLFYEQVGGANTGQDAPILIAPTRLPFVVEPQIRLTFFLLLSLFALGVFLHRELLGSRVRATRRTPFAGEDPTHLPIFPRSYS